MMDRWQMLSRLATLAAVGSAIVAALAVRDAVRVDPLPTSGERPALGDVQAAMRRPTQPARVAAAVDADPFSPARQRPLEPYRLPGEVVEAPAQPTRGNALRVLGTVVVTGGTSFAMCQLGSEPPVIIRIGQQSGPYTLKRVTRGKAVFTSPSGEVEIAAPQPGR